MSLSSAYLSLPIPLQNAACNATALKNLAVRYGPGFQQILDGYLDRASWSSDQISSYRDERLRRIVVHAAQTVPYYRNVFSEMGLDPQSIRTLDDLKALPVLTKATINGHPADFISEKYRHTPLIHRHTSGTTGSSFKFAMNRMAFVEQWAVCWRFWELLGIPFGTPCAVFGTRRIASPNQKEPPFWRSKAPSHQTYFSAFHESPSNMQHYFAEIDRQHIRWIHGYPSLIAPLASYILNTGKQFAKPIEHVTLSAENLESNQRAIFEAAFGIAPRQMYGMSEGVSNASESGQGTLYIDEDYGAMEVVSLEEGRPTEVLGTSLTNYAMPLIRYKTNDLATCMVDEGGHRYLSSLDGRAEDCVRLPDGTSIGKLDHVFKDTLHFREVQIHQREDYSLDILVVPVDSNTAGDEALACEELASSLPSWLPYRFIYVDSLKKSPDQKLRFVVTDVPKARGN